MIIKALDKESLEDTMKVVDEFLLYHHDDNYFINAWLEKDFYRDVFFNPLEEFNTFIAIKSDDKLVLGFIIGKGYTKEIYEIRHHYVRKNYRQQGVAKKLKNHLTDYVREQDYVMITSDVDKNNLASIRLNESCGWEKCILDDTTYRFIRRLK